MQGKSDWAMETISQWAMIIVIDLGYLLFYRAHATKRWIGFQNDKVFDDITLCTYFQSHLSSQLEKLKKKYKPKHIFFCKDDRSTNIWRKSVFPDYKGNRPTSDELVQVLQTILHNEVVKFGCILDGEGLEADDVAFLTVEKYKEHHPREQILVITGDRDFLQMATETVIIQDCTGKALRSSGDPHVDIMLKVLMGDPSDNIPAICKGCGKKTAEMLVTNPQKLQDYIEYKKCKDAYDRNRTLILFEYIPSTLVQTFYQQYGHHIRDNGDKDD